jgi:gamma-glutamyl:cysteine ligase YbdK (ATP-grasp superfamily)
MSASELAAAVGRALDVDSETFHDRARAEATQLKEEIRSGTFDNTEAIVGMELELYAVDDRTDALRRVPRQLLGLIGFEKELGLHNAEMQTSPQPLNSHGLAAQRDELKASLLPAQQRVHSEGIRLVSDGMWTVPPNGETARDYLCDCVEENGVRIGTNMTDAVRYHTMANTAYPSAFEIDAPHVSLRAETVMPESLITSIQPHYQIPHAPDLPEYFSYALRIAAPVLALSVNSPFFPPDLYDDAPDDDIVADAHMENRIGVFESVLNPPEGDSTRPKVCFPPDFETVEDAIDDIVEDDCIVPRELQSGTRFDDDFVHFRHKHGSYWRWVRPVFEGPTRSAANARIEFRPLPAQPTVDDAIAFEALVAGLMESLVRFEHPIKSQDWETAKENFYAATRDGLQADMEWITADGATTTSTDEIYGELFEHAREGLEGRGLSTEAAHEYLRPLRERADRRQTPARWKHDYVHQRVEENVPLAEAIWGMQAAYIRQQKETLLDGSFLDWLE